MKLLTIAALALAALVSADVSHLERNYLPPSRTTTFSASHGYSTVPDGISAIGVHKEKLVAAPVHAAHSHQHIHSAPARTYEAHLASPAISPQHSLGSYSTSSGLVHKAPQVNAPIVHHVHTAPVATHQSHSSPVAISSSSHVSGGQHQAPLGYNHASHYTPSNYVAPTQHVAHQQIHHAPIVHHGYTAPVSIHPKYSSPVALSSSSHTSNDHHKAPLVHNHVSHTTANHVAPAVVPAHYVEHPQTHHSAPAKQSYITSHHAAPVASSYSNFNSYSAPAQDKYRTHSAPAVVGHYAAPAASNAYSSASSKYAAPPSVAHSYISPAAALETFSKSLGHKTYSTPSHSHSNVLSTDSKASGYDTKYAANGGYVY